VVGRIGTQGGPLGESRRSHYRLRVSRGQLRRAGHRRVPNLFRRSRRIPGGQRLLPGGVGATLAGDSRYAGSCHPARERPVGVAGADPAVGRWQAATRRGRHRLTQGPLCPGAPPRQDAKRPAHSTGGEDSRLHLWTVSKRSPRATVASSGRPFGLSNYTSHV
jgi:hypothetical protein